MRPPIPEHLERIGMPFSAINMLLNGAYVRDYDRGILNVKDMRVLQGMIVCHKFSQRTRDHIGRHSKHEITYIPPCDGY